MKRLLIVLLFLFSVLAGAIWWLVEERDEVELGGGRLQVHCAAGFRRPMTMIARQYEEEFAVRVDLQFGGSGALASQLEIAGGDLFLPADASYLEAIRKRGGVLESLKVARLTAGVVVARGNPKGITSLGDLGRAGLRISLAEKSASIGKHTWAVLDEVGLLGEITPNVVVTKPTVNNVVEDIAIGAADAAIVWDAVVRDYSGVEWIAVPEFTQRAKRADLGVLATSDDVERARHFARYVVDSNRGRKVFDEMGFARPERD